MEAARSGVAPPGATARSPRSCPAQKPRPAPVITSTRAPAVLTVPSAARTSSCIAVLKLLSRSGRLKVSRATPALTSKRIVCSLTFVSVSLLVVVELERSALHPRLTGEHVALLELPVLQSIVLRHHHLAPDHLGAAGRAHARATGERQLHPGAGRRIEHRLIVH